MTDAKSENAISRAEEAAKAAGVEDLTDIEEGVLYDVKLVNRAETNHFHNGLFAEMYKRGLYPLHTDFADQEVEFSYDE